VIRFLHALAGTCFTLLGIAAFTLFILLRNSIDLGGLNVAMTLRLFTLPLLFSGVLYGGTSLVLSLSQELDHPNRTFVTVVLAVLLALFLAVLGIDLGFIRFV
jgi:hypothetical protein